MKLGYGWATGQQAQAGNAGAQPPRPQPAKPRKKPKPYAARRTPQPKAPRQLKMALTAVAARQRKQEQRRRDKSRDAEEEALRKSMAAEDVGATAASRSAVHRHTLCCTQVLTWRRRRCAPARGASAQQRQAMQLDAVVLADEDHEAGVEELERRFD